MNVRHAEPEFSTNLGGSADLSTPAISDMPSVTDTANARPMTVDERRQVEHELAQAYTAARAYEARLELAGLDEHRAVVRGQREDIARRLASLDDSESETERACRECGCTDDRACPGGCSWAEPDLCSACDEPFLDREGNPYFNGAFGEARPMR